MAREEDEEHDQADKSDVDDEIPPLSLNVENMRGLLQRATPSSLATAEEAAATAKSEAKRRRVSKSNCARSGGP